MSKSNRKGNITLIVVAVLVIAGIFVFGGIGGLLSIGIADDYLLWDDFGREYIDPNLWTSQILEGGITPTVATSSLGDSYLSYSGASVDKWSRMTLSPNIDDAVGKSFKFKMALGETEYNNEFGWPNVKIIMNGVTMYDFGYINYRSRLKETQIVLVELIPSFEDPETYVIRFNGEDVKVVDIGNAEGDGRLTLQLELYSMHSAAPGSIQLYDMKYKYEYNCRINDDEILIFDSFSAGSTVGIDTLSHEPVKFCLDYPIKARSFEESGIKTDIRGEILQKIVRGESVTVPENEEWKVYSITKFTDDIKLRCEIAEAYNTNIGECENPAEATIVGCKADSDCYIPPSCNGLSAQCLDNKCVFAGACIFQPDTAEVGLWDRIMNLGFIQWIAGLFN